MGFNTDFVLSAFIVFAVDICINALKNVLDVRATTL